jgi:hypothetical protein
VSGYRSTMRVWPIADTQGAFLTWHATFDAADGHTPQQAVTAVTEGTYAPATLGTPPRPRGCSEADGPNAPAASSSPPTRG